MIVGYCILNGKKWVMFEDKQCAAGEVKLTDGFKDKLIRWNSDKLIGMESISPVVIGSIHQNSGCAYRPTTIVVTMPSSVCQMWREKASRKEVPSSSRFCVFQLTACPVNISKTNLL